MSQYSKKKIDEALQLLESAAKDKKDDLKGYIGERYRHIRSVFKPEGQSAIAQSTHELKNRVKKLEESWNKGRERTQNFLETTNKNVHEKPLQYIGGAAVTSFVLGLMFRQRKGDQL